MIDVTLSQFLALRLARQHLGKPLPPDSILAGSAGGIQNTPPGSAALSVHARVAGLTPAAFDQALAAEKSVLQAYLDLYRAVAPGSGPAGRT